jgi:uncharacterized membrane protein
MPLGVPALGSLVAVFELLLDLFAAIAYVLDSLFHFFLGHAFLARLIAYFMVLPAGDAGPVLGATAGGMLV